MQPTDFKMLWGLTKVLQKVTVFALTERGPLRDRIRDYSQKIKLARSHLGFFSNTAQ
jgi:hypothetical protein